MAVPALVGTPGAAVASVTSVVNPTTLTPGTGSGYAIGDTLLCFTACRSATPTVATPSGWTSILNTTGTNGRLALFAKVAASTSEAAPSVVWSGLTTGNSGTPVQARVAAFSSLFATLASIVDVTGAVANGAAGTTTSAGGAAITTLTDNDLVLSLTTRLDDAFTTFTAPSGFTNVTTAFGTTSGSDFAMGWAYQVKTPAGAVTAPNFGLTGASSFASSGVAIALKALPPTLTSVARISLGSASTPGVRTGHSLNVRARTTAGSGTIRMALYEGATNRSGDLETATITGSLADYTLSIPAASAANITDYSNLEIRLWGYSPSGAATFSVAEVSLVIPASVTPPAKVATLTENFNAALDTTTKWDVSGAEVTLSSNRLLITPTTGYPSLTSHVSYDLVASSAFCQLVQALNIGSGSTDTIFGVQVDLNNEATFDINNGVLIMHSKTAAVSSDDTSITYNATTHAWLRIRESGGNLLWDTSTDGLTWTNRRSIAAPGWVSASRVDVIFVAGYGAEASPGTALFDNLNIAPTVTPMKSIVKRQAITRAAVH